MYKARHYTSDGTEAGDRDLPVWLFDGIVNEHVLYQAVRAYGLNQRQGTASARTRSELRGGGRKPWRQKGTGRARHGSIRSPIWAGGGVIFPPKPKSWRVDLPKKVKRLARRSALNVRADEEQVVVVDELSFEAPKTKRLRELLETIGVDGKMLLLTDGVKQEVYLSGRNMPEVRVMPFGQESAYDVLWASTVVVEQPALEAANERAEEQGLVEKAERRIARAEAAEAAEPEERTDVEAAEPTTDVVEEPDTSDVADDGQPEDGTEADEAEPEAGASAVDVDDIELPTVKELADFLAEIDDVETVRALQERDERKTAQSHYDARIAELSGEEGRDDA